MALSPQVLFIVFTLVVIIAVLVFARDFTVGVLVVTLLTNLVVISAQLHVMYRNMHLSPAQLMAISEREARDAARDAVRDSMKASRDVTHGANRGASRATNRGASRGVPRPREPFCAAPRSPATCPGSAAPALSSGHCVDTCGRNADGAPSCSAPSCSAPAGGCIGGCASGACAGDCANDPWGGSTHYANDPWGGSTHCGVNISGGSGSDLYYPGAVGNEADIWLGAAGNGLHGTSAWADPAMAATRAGHRDRTVYDERPGGAQCGSAPGGGGVPRDRNPIYSPAGAPPCDLGQYDTSSRELLDGDERIALFNRQHAGGDARRATVGRVRANADYYAQFIAEELAEEEDSIWWGRGE